jgi:hypothetical protein
MWYNYSCDLSPSHRPSSFLQILDILLSQAENGISSIDIALNNHDRDKLEDAGNAEGPQQTPSDHSRSLMTQIMRQCARQLDQIMCQR